MAKISGRRLSVGFGKESTRGTAVSPVIWTPKTDYDFDEKIDTVENESSIGVLVDSTEAEIVRQYAEGSITANLGVNSIALLLYSLFGSVNTTLASTGAYKHTFSLLTSNQRPSLSVAVYDPNGSYKFPLGVVKKLKIKYEQDKYITYTVELSANKGTADGALTPTFADEGYLLGRHATITIADTLAGLGAGTVLNVRSFELEINTNTDEEYVLGSISPSDFLNTSVSISGSIESTYNSEAEYKTIALAGSQKSLRINAVNTAKTIGASSNPTLKIDLAKIKFTEWAKKMGNNEIVTQTCKIKGLFSIADAQAIVAELTNTVTSI